MDAVLLGLLAGALFGAMTVAVRAGLLRGGDPALGGVVITGSAFVVASALAVPSVLDEGLDLATLLPFAAIGFFVPGLSQLLFILAVRYAGPSRAAILIGTAPPLQATAVTLLAAAVATTLWVTLAGRAAGPGWGRTLRAFAPAGLLLALAYGALVTGFDRGDVGIVAPLNATQSLWAVAFAALFYRRSEAIGRKTVLAGVLVVLGGGLIGAFR